MKTIGLWMRRGFGLLALGLGAAGLFGLGSTLVDAIAAGASLLALLPMIGIALGFILPLLVLGAARAVCLRRRRRRRNRQVARVGGAWVAGRGAGLWCSRWG
jgi:membrane protein implicated in regulation of membrane protease activity